MYFLPMLMLWLPIEWASEREIYALCNFNYILTNVHLLQALSTPFFLLLQMFEKVTLFFLHCSDSKGKVNETVNRVMIAFPFCSMEATEACKTMLILLLCALVCDFFFLMILIKRFIEMIHANVNSSGVMSSDIF